MFDLSLSSLTFGSTDRKHFIKEFQRVLNQLNNTSSGNILDKHDIGGPSICCTWVSSRHTDTVESAKI